jgi:mRNA interferase RelE/StbE
VPSAALTGLADCYKTKLRTIGYRLVYRVEEDVVYVTVIAVGKRERSRVYTDAKERLDATPFSDPTD